jgi:hypothetical protein
MPNKSLQNHISQDERIWLVNAKVFTGTRLLYKASRTVSTTKVNRNNENFYPLGLF